MMDEQFENILIEALDQLDAGIDIDQILASYPAHAAELRPILEAAVALAVAEIKPAPEAQIASRREFLNQAASIRDQAPRQLAWWPRLAGGAFALLLLLVAVGGGISASASALPGEPLYGLKRGVEQLRLTLSSDRSQFEQYLDGERRNEVARLIERDQIAQVEFRGQVTSIDGDTWQIDQFRVVVSETTLQVGDPQTGAFVVVTGEVLGEQVVATQITVIRQAPATATPAPTATAIPTATAKAKAIPTATATVTPTIAATATPTLPPATPTRSQPTSVPTSVPSVVLPTPLPGNENENAGNDNNGNDNNGNDNNGNDDNDNGGSDDNPNSNDSGSGSGGGGGSDDNANSNDSGSGSGGGGGSDDNANSNDSGGGSGSGSNDNSSDDDDDDNDDN